VELTRNPYIDDVPWYSWHLLLNECSKIYLSANDVGGYKILETHMRAELKFRNIM